MKKIEIYKDYEPDGNTRELNNKTYLRIMFDLFSWDTKTFRIDLDYCNELNILKREKN